MEEEQAIIRNLVKQIKDVPGVICEVGVYEGGSAKIIREESEKELYLFDTFDGFADELNDTDPKHYQIGDCAANEQVVRNLMKNENNVFITKGKFPDTANVIKNKKFAFVHIDTDIYNATKNSLEFFIPKMSPGGVILIHDYPAHSGVKKAVDEFNFTNLTSMNGRQARIQF